MKNQLTTGVAVFAATAILFLGIGAAIAATTTTLSPFPVGSTTAVSCAAGSGKLKNFSVETDSETVSCPAPTTTTTTVPPTTTTTVAGTSGGSPTLSASAAEYIVETVNSQGTSSAGAVLTLSSATGLSDGLAVVDVTAPASIPDQPGTGYLGPTIASISGNKITLTDAVTTVSVNDVLNAAACTAHSNEGECPVYYQPTPAPGAWDNPTQFVGENTHSEGPQSGLVSPQINIENPPIISTTMAANSPQDVTWHEDIAGVGGGITVFPAEGTYNYTGVVDNYASLTQTYRQTLPVDGDFTGWNMTEDYFTEPGQGTGNFNSELSIQETYSDPQGNHHASTALTQGTDGGIKVASGTSGTDTLTTSTSFNNAAIGSAVTDSTHPSSIPSGTTIAAVSGTTGLTLSHNLAATIAGDTINIAGGWNYGIAANDIGPIGSGVGTASAGSSGGDSITIPASDFTTPSTNMGQVAPDDIVTDTTNPSYVPSGTYVTNVNQTTGVLTLNHNLSGTVTGNTISIGLLWYLQDGAHSQNSNGSCESVTNVCGQLVLHPGCDENALPDNTQASGTIDTKAVVTWLEGHSAPQSSGLAQGATLGTVPDPCPNPYFKGTPTLVQDPVVSATPSTGWAPYGYIRSGSSVANLGQGWEVCSTNSVKETLTLSNFTIAATT